jgi:hypothetical protein
LSFSINSLSNFSSFLKIVKSVLFFNLLFVMNLTSNFLGMVDKSLLFLFFNLSFLLFNLLLLLDLIHVVLSLNSGLISKVCLLLRELSLSSNFEISLDSFSLCLFQSLSFSGLSLTFFKSSLGSKCINFSLSVSSLLLEFS